MSTPCIAHRSADRSAPDARLVLILLPVLAFVVSAAGPPTSQEAHDTPGPCAETPSFRSARECLLKGEYEHATRLYESLGAAPSDAALAACGRSEIHRILGRHAQGIALLRETKARGKVRAARHACLAALLEDVGRYQEAIDQNRRALVVDDDNTRARWQLGRVYETLGRTEDAVKTYEAFEEIMVGGTLPQDPADLTCIGNGFLRHSILMGHPDLMRRTRHVLREVFQEAFDFVDPLYWPAVLAAAELLLEKHDLHEAQEDFERVCRLNPRVPAAYVGLGRIALARGEWEKAEEHARAALDIQPNSVAARLLLADLRMSEHRYADAAKMAREALDTNANSLEALSVLAAAQLRGGNEAASQETQRRVRQINPKPALLHQVLGVWLSGARQFDQARRHFERAIAFAPTWPHPRTELGLLQMETGQEALARETLEAAFERDAFNMRTHNVLQLLDRLETFACLRTEHFIIKYDEQEDWVLAPYFAEALEEMYGELCGHLAAGPETPTLVEVFPDHLGFSRRIAGRPFVATIGACTGPVIALAAPRGTFGFGLFNWKTVLRHEFVHTLTLGATGNRIPRWLTEGLAVHEEALPRAWNTKWLLARAVRDDTLFTLAAIDWGFVRPERPTDVSQAYSQSEWMIEYIIERFGDDAIHNLLDAFLAGKTQEVAVRDTLKIEPEAFDEAFAEWAARQVSVWGLPVRAAEKPDEVRKLVEESPADAALLARLASAEWRDGKSDDAEETARHALALCENQPLALEVLAHVLVNRALYEKDEGFRQGFLDRAEPVIRRLHAVDPHNPAAVKYLGYVEQSRRHWQAAIRFLSHYQRRFPEDPDPYRRLAAIHLERGDHEVALAQLERLFHRVDDEPAVARQIASIHREQGRHPRVAHWLRRAIEIDPYDPATHEELADAHLASGRYAAAEEGYKVLCRLAPESPAGYKGLARLCKTVGNFAEAAAYQKKAEALRGTGDDDPLP